MNLRKSGGFGVMSILSHWHMRAGAFWSVMKRENFKIYMARDKRCRLNILMNLASSCCHSSILGFVVADLRDFRFIFYIYHFGFFPN